MRKLQHFMVESIRLEPDKGRTVLQCVQEAICLAIEEGCSVVFKHNGTEYTADPKAITDKVLETERKVGM